jgi:squamous cell carcinoma antigen recognized by T-cells 3
MPAKHLEMEATFSDFSAFVTKYRNDKYEATMSSTSKDYGKALKALREREIFELKLKQSNGSFEVFAAYLQWEQTAAKVQNPLLIQALFERTLVTYWQQPNIWEDYANYIVTTLTSQLKCRFKSRKLSTR